MIQGSDEWKNWRKGKVGASLLPVLCGHYNNSTPFAEWQRKLGLIEEQESNWAMQKGTNLEPRIRAVVEFDTGRTFTPKIAEWSEWPTLAVSLDGISDDGKTVLEIKAPGKEVFDLCSRGVVADIYQPQLEAQLLATGADEVLFACGREEKGKELEVVTCTYKSQPMLKAMVIEKAKEFWNYVETKTAPPLVDKDVLIREEPELQVMAEEAKQLKEIMDSAMVTYQAADESLQKIKKELVSHMKHTNERIGSIHLYKVRKPIVDTKKAEADGLNLEPYKRFTEFYKMDVSR